MPEHKYAGHWLLMCVAMLIGTAGAHAAFSHAAPKHAALKHAVFKHPALNRAANDNAVPLPKPNPRDRVAPKRAAARRAATKDASSAITLARLAGSWKSVKSGMEVRIEQGPMGWEAWFSTSGEARITLVAGERQTIKIQSRTFACAYTVTLPAAQTMKWELTRAQPVSQCLEDSFTRLGPAPGTAKPIAPVNPAAQSKHVFKKQVARK